MQIVAELSCNHQGDLQRAKDLVTAAKDAGADAVKLQCWHPDVMVVDKSYVLSGGTWDGRNLYDLYQEAWTPWEWFPPLFDHAAYLGIEMFSSVFDYESLSFLENLGCPRYKIASFEAFDHGLISAAIDTGKEVIISTGLMSEQDVRARLTSTPDVTLLLCVSEYPAAPESYNLGRIRKLQDTWHAHVGVSDHTLGSVVAVTAAALGAEMVEKHMQLEGDATLDSAFSLTPREFAAMVRDCREAEAALGVSYPLPSAQSKSYGKSLYVHKPIKAGTVLTLTVLETCVRASRPNKGLPPMMLPYAVGNIAARDLVPGEPFTEACYAQGPLVPSYYRA